MANNISRAQQRKPRASHPWVVCFRKKIEMKTKREQEVEQQLTRDLKEMLDEAMGTANKMYMLGLVSGMMLGLYASGQKFSVNFIPDLKKKLIDIVK